MIDYGKLDRPHKNHNDGPNAMEKFVACRRNDHPRHWRFDARRAGTLNVAIAKTAAGVNITYTGTLQTADAVTGPYPDVPGATSPYSATTTSAAAYFRARQ